MTRMCVGACGAMSRKASTRSSLSFFGVCFGVRYACVGEQFVGMCIDVGSEVLDAGRKEHMVDLFWAPGSVRCEVCTHRKSHYRYTYMHASRGHRFTHS